jgi:hypothetical protein
LQERVETGKRLLEELYCARDQQRDER